MKKLEVFGAAKLKGHIRISGSKNASLPILAATLLSNKKISLANLPRVKDIETMILLLKSLGSVIDYNKKELIIKNTKQTKTFAAYSLVKTMRAGILVLGPLLAKFGKAKVSLPGGCAIGTRPLPAKIYANEGVAQFLFLKGDQSPETSYADRKGKYMGQTGVTLPKV